MEKSILEKPIYQLLHNEPFFANFLLGSNIIYNDKQVTRAACSIRQNKICFYINTDWYGALPLKEQVSVLKHEVLHILLDHVGTRMTDTSNRQAKNIAMDCAINQYIADLPSDCVTLESTSKMCKKELAPFETWEYYYQQMKDFVENNSNEANDHDVMDGEGVPFETDSQLRRAIVRDQAEKATKASKGLLSDAVSKILQQMNDKSQVNWKQQFRNIIFSSRVTQTKPSRLKVHRRFELDQPGRKKDKRLVLGVCVDSSGSVSDEAFAMFMSEIYHVAKMTSVTYVIHADTEVHKVDVIKGGKAKKEALTKRHCQGGTAYQPAIDEAMKKECDVVVYFGDLDCADTPTNPGVPFIWVRVGKQDPPGNFGKVIDLD